MLNDLLQLIQEHPNLSVIPLVDGEICIDADWARYMAEIGSYNISKEADNFNSYRRVIVIDCITGDTMFVVEGWISINADMSDHQLEIIAEDGKNSYKKHFIGLSDNVSYTVEDLNGNNVDRYTFTINYNPKMWIPFSLKNID